MLERRDGVVPFGDMLTQCNATHKERARDSFVRFG